MAPQDVVLIRPGNGRKQRSRFVLNPATGALVVAPDARPEIEKALTRALRRIKFRLYPQLALLYVAQFRLKCTGATLHVLRYVLGCLG